MNETLQFMVKYGAAVLFTAVFIEQLGIPLPAAPWMLAAGALAAAGKINWVVALVAATLGSAIADLIWFYLGRYGGHRIIRVLCRISLEPDSCVRRTQDIVTRYGMKGIVAAKFIPGLSTVVPPLAGSSGMKTFRFLFFDGIGSLLYAGCFILVGALFGRQLNQVIVALTNLGKGALEVVVALAALYIAYKYYQRHRLFKELRMARITVDELHQIQETGEKPIILDLRSVAEVERNPSLIRGARHMTVDQVRSRQHEIPRDRDIILYCSCPNEASSARMALLLQRSGVLRVRPLQGGIDAWRERNYPMELRVVGTVPFPPAQTASDDPPLKK